MERVGKSRFKKRPPKLTAEVQQEYAEFVVKPAEYNVVNTSYVTLLPAPGAGKAIKFEGALLNLYGGTADGDVDGDTCIRYTDNSGQIVSAVADDFFNDGTAGTCIYLVPQGAQEAEATANEIGEIALTANAALVLHTDADISASVGTRMLRVGIWYRIVDVLT